MTEVSEHPEIEMPAPTLPPLWEGGDRSLPSLHGDERHVLTAQLDFHRTTFELKCSGIAPERLSERSVAPSELSLHGLLRHLADVERWWFRIQWGQEDVPLLYHSPEDPGRDFREVEGDVAEAFTAWRAECARSREIVATEPDLDRTVPHKLTGDPVSVRAVLSHMIAEYARHNGHADLLRERLDGATGL
ncbi:DinB family protein [Streptomyces massasporeus]|uniref:DinB family protein n=1 Tax=Streptomyces massasporeus TaxID=67324 RepID=UPI00371401D9